MNEFSITNPKPIRKGALLGFFDVEMPSGMIIRGTMLFEKEGRRWVGLPSKEYTKDGVKAYSPIIEFGSKDRAEKFQQLVLPLAEKALLVSEDTQEIDDSVPF